jgi:hypothetical protein
MTLSGHDHMVTKSEPAVHWRSAATYQEFPRQTTSMRPHAAGFRPDAIQPSPHKITFRPADMIRNKMFAGP